MNNLDQKIIDFCQAIRETKECQNFKQAAEIYGSDLASQTLMDDFLMAQQELAILKEGNFSGQEEQEKKFESLLGEVRKNKPINDLVMARKQMEILIGDLATVLSNDIGFPFSLPPKKGCGCGG